VRAVVSRAANVGSVRRRAGFASCWRRHHGSKRTKPAADFKKTGASAVPIRKPKPLGWALDAVPKPSGIDGSPKPDRPNAVLYFERAWEDGFKGLRRQVCTEMPIHKYDIRIRYIMEYFYIQIFQRVRAKFCCSCLVVVRSLLPVRLTSGRVSAAIGVEEMPVVMGTGGIPTTMTGSMASARAKTPGSNLPRSGPGPAIWRHRCAAGRAGRAASNGPYARPSQDEFPAVGEEGLSHRKVGPYGLPHSRAPVYAAIADRLPRASLAPNSATKSQIAEGLVFGSKAGNKPVKDGS
jgi:hypothetical protein